MLIFVIHFKFSFYYLVMALCKWTKLLEFCTKLHKITLILYSVSSALHKVLTQAIWRRISTFFIISLVSKKQKNIRHLSKFRKIVTVARANEYNSV